MIFVSTQQAFPGETKGAILFVAIAYFKSYLAKSGMWESLVDEKLLNALKKAYAKRITDLANDQT